MGVSFEKCKIDINIRVILDIYLKKTLVCFYKKCTIVYNNIN